MGDLIRPDTSKSKARLKLVRRAPGLHGYDFRPPGSLVAAAEAAVRFAPRGTMMGTDPTRNGGRLISSRDAAISRTLQEQTQFVLARLTPRERLVLRLRFGIAQTGDPPWEKSDEMLTRGEIACIEAAALRKLRHPSQGVRLKSVDRR